MGGYELLPHNSLDLSRSPTSATLITERPTWLRTKICFSSNLPLRHTRHIKCICLYLVIAIICIALLNAIFNSSYINPPPFSQPSDESVFIAANIVSSSLVYGQWTVSLIKLARKFPPQRVHVSVYGGPKEAMDYLRIQLAIHDIPNTIIDEESSPVNLSDLSNITLPNGAVRTKRIAFLAAVRNKALEPLARQTIRFHKILFLNDVFYNPDDAIRLLFGTNVQHLALNHSLDEIPRTSYRAACAIDYANPFKLYDTFASRDLEGYSMGVPLFPYFVFKGKARSWKDMVQERQAVRVRSCWGGMVAFDGRFFQSLPPPESNMTAALEVATVSLDLRDRHKMKTDYDMFITEALGGKAAATFKPIKFRAEADIDWEGSECCLVHADLMNPTMTIQTGSENEDTGIYFNPYVRVTYSQLVFKFLWLGHRLERLMILPQTVFNILARMPQPNNQRLEQYQESYVRREFKYDPDATNATIAEKEQTLKYAKSISTGVPFGAGIFSWSTSVSPWVDGVNGYFVYKNQTAGKGGWCATHQLFLLLEHKNRKDGRPNWEHFPIPEE